MFFVENVPYYYHECEEAVINEKGDEFVGEAVVKYHNSVMEKTTVAKPEKASAADQTAQQSAEAQTQAATEAATQADNTVEGKDD